MLVSANLSASEGDTTQRRALSAHAVMNL